MTFLEVTFVSKCSSPFEPPSRCILWRRESSLVDQRNWNTNDREIARKIQRQLYDVVMQPGEAFLCVKISANPQRHKNEDYQKNGSLLIPTWGLRRRYCENGRHHPPYRTMIITGKQHAVYTAATRIAKFCGVPNLQIARCLERGRGSFRGREGFKTYETWWYRIRRHALMHHRVVWILVSARILIMPSFLP